VPTQVERGFSFLRWFPTRGRCRTPNYHCQKPDDSGHGPNLRLTYKTGGETLTETFPTIAVQRKAEREIAGFRRCRELSRELVEQ
jgi:hypothetical protein